LKEIKKIVSKLKSGLDTALKLLFAYISIVGLVGFSLFIMEESCQQITFGCFSTTDVGQWGQTKRNIEAMERIVSNMEAINAVFIALQPIQWWAYQDYINASKNYIESLHLTILANEPGLYLGEERHWCFYWKSAYQRDDMWVLKNGRILTRTTEPPRGKEIELTGVLESIGSNLYELKAIIN